MVGTEVLFLVDPS